VASQFGGNGDAFFQQRHATRDRCRIVAGHVRVKGEAARTADLQLVLLQQVASERQIHHLWPMQGQFNEVEARSLGLADDFAGRLRRQIASPYQCVNT
jgi:hypothetical protein